MGTRVRARAFATAIVTTIVTTIVGFLGFRHSESSSGSLRGMKIFGVGLMRVDVAEACDLSLEGANGADGAWAGRGVEKRQCLGSGWNEDVEYIEISM